MGKGYQLFAWTDLSAIIFPFSQISRDHPRVGSFPLQAMRNLPSFFLERGKFFCKRIGMFQFFEKLVYKAFAFFQAFPVYFLNQYFFEFLNP